MTKQPPMESRIASPERRALLERLFRAIANRDDWKAPVEAVVPVDMWELYREAVINFTATVPLGLEIPGDPHHYRLVAEGYRAGPAGDH